MLMPGHHQRTVTVGARIRKSALSVWETMAAEWSRACLQDNEQQHISTAIEEALENAKQA
jgi:hypothetical protein